MKRFFAAIFLLFAMISTEAQAWIGLEGGTNGPVYCMDTFEGQLIVGGNFTQAGFGGGDTAVMVNNIAAWNGSRWSALGSGITGTGGQTVNINAMAVFNGELYVAGYNVDTAGGVRVYNVAKWNGSNWLAVGTGFNPYSTTNALCIYNNALYAGGLDFVFTGNENHATGIAKWNDSAWVGIGSDLAGGAVYSMQVYNNLLYIGWASGYPSVAISTWNDTAFLPVGSGIGLSNEYVATMAVYHGNLYVSGNFGDYNADYYAVWNGTTWDSLPGNGTGTIAGSTSMVVYDDALVSGNAVSTGPFDLRRFNGTSWNTFGGGYGSGLNGTYSALFVYNGNLYASGNFNSIEANTNNIAEWTGPTTGINNIAKAGNDHIYPNPASDLLYIDSHEPFSPVIITNILGQQVIKQTVTGTHTVVDISSLAAGMYFANNSKFIKQ